MGIAICHQEEKSLQSVLSASCYVRFRNGMSKKKKEVGYDMWGKKIASK